MPRKTTVKEVQENGLPDGWKSSDVDGTVLVWHETSNDVIRCANLDDAAAIIAEHYTD